MVRVLDFPFHAGTAYKKTARARTGKRCGVARGSGRWE
jgi:hypothetical protein